MTWRSLSQASMAASLLLPVLTGCAYLPLHKESPPPVPIIATAPSLTPPPISPLYTEMSQKDPALPDLPTPPPPGAQPVPPPASIVSEVVKKPQRPLRRVRGRKGEIEVADREAHEREAHEKETTGGATENGAGPNGAGPAEAQNTKVTASTPTGDTTQPTPIGQLTAGPTPDTTGSRRQAADLIDSTERGINSLHRNLSSDQVKTVAQIRSFLAQAQRAIHNGDVDGAYTLATKAKTLLDELTGAS